MLSNVINEIKQVGKVHNRVRASTTVSLRERSSTTTLPERQASPTAALVSQSYSTADTHTSDGHPYNEEEVDRLIEQMKTDTNRFIQYELKSDKEPKSLIGFFSYHAVQWLIEKWKCKDRNQARDWLENLLQQNRIRALQMKQNDQKVIKFGTYFYYFYDNLESNSEDEDDLTESHEYPEEDEINFNLIELKFPEIRLAFASSKHYYYKIK